MPALDLALCLGLVGVATEMIHAIFIEVFGQVTGDGARAVVAEQPQLVQHGGC